MKSTLTIAASLMREMRAISFVTDLIDEGKLASNQYKRINVHWIEIGGTQTTSTDIFMEGLQLRSIKIWKRGEPVEEVYRIIECNSRLPQQLLGDVEAQLAGCLLGRDLVARLVERYGAKTFRRAVSIILDQSEAAARAVIRAMPDGVYEQDDQVDDLIGVYGSREGLRNHPDGNFLPAPVPRCREHLVKKASDRLNITCIPARLSILTKPIHGRMACHYCGQCNRGCAVNANFTSPNVLLFPAQKTGKLTIITNAMAREVTVDDRGLATGVSYIDKKIGVDAHVRAKVVVLAASACESARILLNSKSSRFPQGLANSSGMVGKYLTYAFVALGLVMLWGHAGILSLGQGVFFGLGGYMMAMFLKLEASDPISTKIQSTPGIPDFMDWNQLTALPLWWVPFKSLPFALIAVLVVPVALAFLISFAMFKRRVGGVYFAIITQAVALILTVLIIGQQGYTGGVNGITDLKTLLGWDIRTDHARLVLYYVCCGLLIASVFLCRWVQSSKLGTLLLAMRDKEDRVRFSGYDVAMFKVFAFCLAAMLSAIGGAMFTLQVGFMSPSFVGIVPSIEMVIFAAVGGRMSLVGSIYGALLVNYGKTYFSESAPDLWLFLMAALFIGVTMAFPNGLAGLVEEKLKPWWAQRQATRKAQAERIAAAHEAYPAPLPPATSAKLPGMDGLSGHHA